MRIGGVEVTGPHEELLVLPRGEQQVVFRARTVLDFNEFEKLCPEPKPPGKLTKDGWTPNLEDQNFRQMLGHYTAQRIAWLVLKSLEPSEIEWKTVEMSNPSTWLNYVTELKDAGFSQVEINRIVHTTMVANALDEAKLEEARKVFLLGQRLAQENSSGPATGQPST